MPMLPHFMVKIDVENFLNHPSKISPNLQGQLSESQVRNFCYSHITPEENKFSVRWTFIGKIICHVMILNDFYSKWKLSIPYVVHLEAVNSVEDKALSGQMCFSREYINSENQATITQVTHMPMNLKLQIKISAISIPFI